MDNGFKRCKTNQNGGIRRQETNNGIIAKSLTEKKSTEQHTTSHQMEQFRSAVTKYKADEYKLKYVLHIL
jgi:hypothetical protein